MKKKLNRRRFIQTGMIATGAVMYSACKHTDKKTSDPLRSEEVIKAPDEMSLSKSMPRDQVFLLLDQKVDHYMKISNNCAQSSFLALSDQFGLGNPEIVKALTPLPGIAERGETCGAVTGGLLALGLVFGRDNINDWQAYRDSLIPANTFCDRFIKETGSTQCCEIVEKSFGTRLDLRDPQDLAQFQRSDATEKCSNIVKTAVRIAADLILDA